MQEHSLIRVFLSALVKGFSKTFGVLLGIVLFWAGINFISSQEKPPRYTTTNICPNHTWKTLPLSMDRPTILRITIDGGIGIKDGNSIVTAEAIEKILCDIPQLEIKEGSLKGIIIAINTRGGDARDAETIRTLLLEAKARFHIPCVVYADGFCASGGVMIACAADKIIASPSSLIGSVGVIMPTLFNLSKPMEMWGIQSKTIHAGKEKDELNPFRPWKENEGEHLQEDLNKYYEKFISMVCQARPRISPDFLRTEGARIYLAQDAKEVGFIDEIENSYFKCLEKFSGSLGVEDNYQVIELIPQFSLGSFFTMGISSLLRPSIEHRLLMPGEVDSTVQGKPLALYDPR
jgi:signal peptide peptidase SppA